MTDRKKTGVAFWATVALVVVLVGYPLSFGPACWFNEWTGLPVSKGYGSAGIGDEVIFIVYRPLFEYAGPYPRSMCSELIHWYAEVGTRNASLGIGYTADGSTSKVCAFGWQRPEDDYGR
jgi:hypothetical protein